MIRIKNELIFIDICSCALLAIVALTPDIWILRLVLGLPLVLFFPGYTLVATLFPARDDIGGTERVALSVALSVVASPLIGFLLNFLWKIDLYPVLIGLTAFTVGMSIAAWYRRRALPEDEQMETIVNLGLGNGKLSFLDKTVSVALAAVFLGAGITLAYVVANPREGERFTEFYIRGAESLSVEVNSGSPLILSLGIVNHERETVTYRIEARLGEAVLKASPPILLSDGSLWEDEMSLAPDVLCARTQLLQPVSSPSVIQVASAALLVPGDTIRINGETATVQQVSGNTVQLAGSLTKCHGAGAAISEVENDAVYPRTELIQPVNAGRSIQVASTASLAPGDTIRIDDEAATVQQISGNTVDLAGDLCKSHAAGAVVLEVQRVELRLIKVFSTPGNAQSSLSLWVGKEHFAANVINTGQAQASYQMALQMTTNLEAVPGQESPVSQVPSGGSWTYETAYSYSENHEFDIILYRNGEAVYRRHECGAYPDLYLWVHVS